MKKLKRVVAAIWRTIWILILAHRLIKLILELVNGLCG